MGCQNSKNEPLPSLPSLKEMREEKENRDEVKYQKKLRKLENYIKFNRSFGREIRRNLGRYARLQNSLRLDAKKFNSRNVSQIWVHPLGDLYSRFYPKRDIDLTDPHFL
jgi:hypothetical protein